MANQDLSTLKVAILVTDGFEQVEMTQPQQALKQAGAETHIVSLKSDRVQGWNHFDKGDFFPVDVSLEQANSSDYDALLLPGGVANPDQLRMNEQAIAFIKSFDEAGKPIAVICHGPWTLIEADVVRGRRIASWPSLKTDLQNAGAEWINQEVVVDGNLVSSRKPDDIPAFNQEMIKLFSQAGKVRQMA